MKKWFFASLKSMKKEVGSGAGSGFISRRYGSGDPDRIRTNMSGNPNTDFYSLHLIPVQPLWVGSLCIVDLGALLCIHDILVRIRIRGFVSLSFGSGVRILLFSSVSFSDLQADKKICCFCLLLTFLKVHLHFKDKKS
jgi:hypothetical protein